MMKVIALFVSAIVLYHIVGATALNKSGFFGASSYYTHPPMVFGDISLSRMPMLFGEQMAIYILENLSSDEIKELIQSGDISVAAILSSYEGDRFFTVLEDRKRRMKIAEIVINNGFDVRGCKFGDTTAGILKRWGKLDRVNISFLLRYGSYDDVFTCSR